MSLSRLQAWKSGGAGGVTTFALAFINAPAAANCILAAIAIPDTATLTSITDDFGDAGSWVKILGPIRDTNSASYNYIYYKQVGTPSGGGKTVTILGSASGGYTLGHVEYASSVAGTWAADGFNSVANTTSTDPSPGAIITTSADGVVVGFVTKSSGTPTAGTGFTLQTTFPAYYGNQVVEDQITTSAASYTANWTAASSTWTALAAALKFTASGASGAVLAASSAATATSTANLTTGIKLAAATAARAAASGALSTGIPLAASASASSTASGSLSTGIPLAASASARASAAGMLDTQIQLSSIASAHADAYASLSTQILLAGIASARSSSSGMLYSLQTVFIASMTMAQTKRSMAFTTPTRRSMTMVQTKRSMTFKRIP